MADLTKLPWARIHPRTLESRDSSDADIFEVDGDEWQIVNSKSVPVGEAHLELAGGKELVLHLEPVAN